MKNRILTPSLLNVALVVMLATASLGLSAIPAAALTWQEALYCMIYGCPTTPEPEPEPAVTPTGIVHPIYMVGDAFMPDRVYAQKGDTIKFYQLVNTTQRVKATDGSWQSTSLSKNQSWSIMIDNNTKLTFKRDTSYSTNMYGEVKVEAVPASYNYGELIDVNGNVIGKNGQNMGVANGLGRTLAGVGGTVQNTLTGISKTGNGLALGLTTSLGLGNN